MSQVMGETTEPRCRQKRVALGLSYPKSGCDKCGSIIRPGWQCAEDAVSVTAAHQPDQHAPPPANVAVAARQEALARLITASKMGLRADPLGQKLPDHLWQHFLGTAQGVLLLIGTPT